MEYYNGNQHIQSHKLEKLSNLTQEEANGLATGPQDLFFDKLDNLNSELSHYGLDTVDVTDKWNWKAGSYDKVKEYIYTKLDLHKKARNMDNLLTRTRDKMNYMGYMERQVRNMEQERMNLKYLGVS